MRRKDYISCPWLVLLLVVLSSCSGSPTEPHPTILAIGRWTGSGACLSVSDNACDLAVGCGHGQFPRPMLRGDGTFDVDGTYRIEAGPVNPNPAPPAHFSGAVSGSRLALTVTPSGQGSATYSMTAGAPGNCPIPCV